MSARRPEEPSGRSWRAQSPGCNTELQASKDAVGNAFAKHEARAAVERRDAWAWTCLVPKAVTTAEDAEDAREAATDTLA